MLSRFGGIREVELGVGCDSKHNLLVVLKFVYRCKTNNKSRHLLRPKILICLASIYRNSTFIHIFLQITQVPYPMHNSTLEVRTCKGMPLRAKSCAQFCKQSLIKQKMKKSERYHRPEPLCLISLTLDRLLPFPQVRSNALFVCETGVETGERTFKHFDTVKMYLESRNALWLI